VGVRDRKSPGGTFRIEGQMMRSRQKRSNGYTFVAVQAKA
jgi:hypothetical protein